MRRRRRKIAAAAGAMLMVPAFVAGEPAAVTSPQDVSALGDAGRGLMGLTDPDDVSADGTLSESDRIGDDLLRDAGNPDALAREGLDLPAGPLGIPGVMLQAYQRAAENLARTAPGCHMDWPLLAAIGRIESNHARGGQVFANGDTVRPILGPVLNGGGFAAISDTDGGALDGELRWDRAVGAMQFIPSTWRQYAADGNGDRISSPHNVFDAALAAGKYLCSGGLDMANPQQRAVAVFRYNHSDSYVRTVLIWADAYAKGVTPLPSTPVPTVPPLQQGGIANPNPNPPPNTTNPGNNPTDPGNGGGGPSSSSSTPSTTTTTPTCEPSTPPPTSTTTSPTSTPPPAGCETTTTPTSTTSSSASGGGDPSGGDPGGPTSTQPTATTTLTPSSAPAESSSTAAESSSSSSSAADGSTTTSPLGP